MPEFHQKIFESAFGVQCTQPWRVKRFLQISHWNCNKIWKNFMKWNYVPFDEQTDRHTDRYVRVPIFCTFCFEKTMHGKINTSYWCEPASFKVCCMLQYTLYGTLEKSCTFKDKCAVNAEILICNLLTGPLIKQFLKVAGKFLKRELSKNV